METYCGFWARVLTNDHNLVASRNLSMPSLSVSKNSCFEKFCPIFQFFSFCLILRIFWFFWFAKFSHFVWIFYFIFSDFSGLQKFPISSEFLIFHRFWSWILSNFSLKYFMYFFVIFGILSKVSIYLNFSTWTSYSRLLNYILHFGPFQTLYPDHRSVWETSTQDQSAPIQIRQLRQVVIPGKPEIFFHLKIAPNKIPSFFIFHNFT